MIQETHQEQISSSLVGNNDLGVMRILQTIGAVIGAIVRKVGTAVWWGFGVFAKNVTQFGQMPSQR